MGGNKLSKASKSQLLSLAVSKEGVVISTAAEIFDKSTAEVEEIWKQSQCYKKLFNLGNYYVEYDTIHIINDFIDECEAMGWESDADG